MRERNINKVLNQYQTLEKAGKVKIYVPEVFNIRDYAIEKYKNGGEEHRILFSLIITALEYGVAVGYSAGKRDKKKKAIKK